MPTAVMVAALAICSASRVTSPSARTVHARPISGSWSGSPAFQFRTATTSPMVPASTRAATTARTDVPLRTVTSGGSLPRRYVTGARHPGGVAPLLACQHALASLGRAEVPGGQRGQIRQVVAHRRGGDPAQQRLGA